MTKRKEVSKEGLNTIGDRLMTDYGGHVLLNRSVPSLYDGLKPVHRRILWAMYDMGLRSNAPYKKGARVIGEVIGKYHPHGETNVEGAMVTLANGVPVPLIDGSGNWGSLTDGPAAMRYIEARLSAWSDLNYYSMDRKLTDLKPTYDHAEKEPVVLNSNFFALLVIGTFGIGVGTSVTIPSFTEESVRNLCQRLLEEPELTSKQVAKILKFSFRHGGVYNPETGDNASEFIRLIETGKGSIEFEPIFESTAKQLIVTGFPKSLESGKTMESIAEMDGVQLLDDQSALNKKTGLPEHKLVINFARSLKPERRKVLERTIIKRFGQRRGYSIAYVEERLLEKPVIIGGVEYFTERAFNASGILDMTHKWLKWRTELEARRIAFDIAKQTRKRERVELWKLALLNRDTLDKCRDQDDPRGWLMKKLKLDEEQADYLLNLRVRDLTRLQAKDLDAEIAAITKVIKGFEKDAKDPGATLLREWKEERK